MKCAKIRNMQIVTPEPSQTQIRHTLVYILYIVLAIWIHYLFILKHPGNNWKALGSCMWGIEWFIRSKLMMSLRFYDDKICHINSL